MNLSCIAAPPRLRQMRREPRTRRSVVAPAAFVTAPHARAVPRPSAAANVETARGATLLQLVSRIAPLEGVTGFTIDRGWRDVPRNAPSGDGIIPWNLSLGLAPR